MAYIKKYCDNSSITGFAYISNHKLHFVERLFWLLCIALSAWGANYVVNQYKTGFDARSVSIVYDSFSLNYKVKFPTIATCTLFHPDNFPQKIEDYIKDICEDNCDQYDIMQERQLLMFVYPYLYTDFSLNCEKRKNCKKCNKCLAKEKREFLETMTFNCSEVFVECSASGEFIDCCHYFLPLITPFGKCFLFNSFQNNAPSSEHWYSREIDAMIDKMEIKIVTSKPIEISILNPEDIPNRVVKSIDVQNKFRGISKTLYVYEEITVNGHDVRDVKPEYRKCRFPDEVSPTSIYRAHSFSACLNDCIRRHQVRLCNCSMQCMVPEADPKYPPCTLEGIYCLEKYAIIKPDLKKLLPWAESNVSCKCLPSCTEKVISKTYESFSTSDPLNPNYTSTIAMPSISLEFYRRQTMRSTLDVIVTIGGSLGLFLGASLISGIEVFYYWILWTCNFFRCNFT